MSREENGYELLAEKGGEKLLFLEGMECRY